MEPWAQAHRGSDPGTCVKQEMMPWDSMSLKNASEVPQKAGTCEDSSQKNLSTHWYRIVSEGCLYVFVKILGRKKSFLKIHNYIPVFSQRWD